MSLVKFYKGVKSNYLSDVHANGIYFATDTNEIIHNGATYGGDGSGAVVKYDTPQTLTKVEQDQACQNIDALTNTDFATYGVRKAVLSWDHSNVRFYGERGSVYDQGFSEFYGFPSTQVTMDVNNITQEVVCLPNDHLGSSSHATVSGLVRSFELTDHDKLRIYGGELSGYSMLGVEGMLNGKAGCMSVAIERVEEFILKERIGFKIMGVDASDGISYASIINIVTNEPIYLNEVVTQFIPFDGSIEGIPTIKVGEWFDWSIKVPANYDNETFMDFYINGTKTPIQLKAHAMNQREPVDSCVAKLSTWPNSTYSPVGAGCYSYHTNYGLTILNEATTKNITNEIIAACDTLYIITPEGNIDYTCIFDDNIEPIQVGHQLSIVANNQYSSINLIGNTSCLLNNIKQITIPINIKMFIEAVNISASNNYFLNVQP